MAVGQPTFDLGAEGGSRGTAGALGLCVSVCVLELCVCVIRLGFVVVPCCWVLLGAVGCCWVLLGAVGCCWVLLGADCVAVGCCWVLIV